MHQTWRTILIVDDSPEDRELYRRFLKRDPEYSYTILEAALGRQGLEMWQQHQPDAVLLDYQLPDLDGLEFITKLQPYQLKPCLPVIMLTGQGNEAIAVLAIKAGTQDYLVKEQITPERLQRAVTGAIETVQVHTQLQQRIEREQLVSQITQKIHQTLDLEEILQLIVSEVRQFLKTDRVFIHRFQPDAGSVVVESVTENWLPRLNLQPEDLDFLTMRDQDYQQGSIQAVADVYSAGLSEYQVELLSRYQIRAILSVPIFHEQRLWGLLVVTHCTGSRQWQPLEIELCQELTNQVGIAFRQAELYQAEKSLREIAQREQAIATVIQKMRQTLDIETIFKTATSELRHLLKCERVVAYQFNDDWSGQFVFESVADGWISLLQPSNNVDDSTQFIAAPGCTVVTTMSKSEPKFIVDTYLQETKGGLYNQGINCRVTSDIYEAGFTPCYVELLEQFQIRAYIIVPIYCGSQLWGLLATYQNSNSRVWSDAEISTVVQITIPLGVTLQQAQLLQETQQQAVQLQQIKDTAVRIAKQSAAANLAKSQFLANMSHDLRTPLNGILGYAQILQADKNCTPKQKEGISIIQSCGVNLLALINDILDISKIEAGKVELYLEDCDLHNLFSSLSEIFQLKARQDSLTFSYFPINIKNLVIKVDENRLRQILTNLLSNALKFTDQGSIIFKVELLADETEQLPVKKIRFQVEDTGIGIASEQLEKIFLPFERVNNGFSQREGTGLGLAITKNIIELMGGKLFVESTPGVGSKFWFDLKLPIVSTFPQLKRQSTNNIIGYSGARRKILVVDDRWENRSVLINRLEPLGFELEQAKNGQEGLEKAVEWQPDLILVDLVMPVLDGYQMTRKLRQLPDQNTIIIAISANAFISDHQKSLYSGCNDFLPKPIQFEELFDRIKSYLSLTWIYDNNYQDQIKKLANESNQVTQTETSRPPQKELLALYEAASSGNVEIIEQEVMRLQQLHPNYRDFVTRLEVFADEFEYEKITNLIDAFTA